MRATLALFRRNRKWQLTTKMAGKGFYKGNRTGRMGEHTKYGGYRIDYEQVRTYVVPEGLKDFKLTPFVTRKALAQPGRIEEGTHRPDAASYLDQWKRDNGDD